MTLQSSLAFVFAMSLFVASPGPGMMGTMAVAVRGDFRNSASFIAGMVIGDLVYLSFAVFGLSAIAQNFGTFFQVIRVLGGIYLLYIGIRLFFSKTSLKKPAADSRKRGSFFAGLFITLSNPKVIIFYCGFLPNFMNLHALTAFDLAVVCMLVAFVITSVMGFYSLLAAKTGGVISRRSGSLLNKSAGAAVGATGIYMISR